jgi:kinetochore protein Nuf2
MSDPGRKIYSFPILKSSSICECINELMPPLKLTPDILEKADAAQLRIIYEGFIEILMAVTKEEMITANKEILAQTITYPELHDGGSIPEVVFFYYLKTLMETVGIQDFTLRDLFEPQFPRTKRFLSAIINFAKFREERLSRYNELAGPTSDLIEKRDLAETDCKAAEDELTAIKTTIAEEEPHVKTLQQDIATKEKTIFDLNKKQALLQEEIHDIKQQTTATIAKGNQVKEQINLVKSQIAKLKSQIVEDPERVKKTIAEMGRALETEKDIVATYEKKQRELQSRMDMLTSINHDVQRCIKILDQIAVEVNKKQEIKQRIVAKKQEIANFEEKIRDLTRDEQQLTRQLASTKEKIQRLEKQIETRKEQTQATIEQIHLERQQVEKERINVKNRIELNEFNIKQMKVEEEMLKKEHMHEINEMTELFEELMRQVNSYHLTLAQMITSSEKAE